MSTSATTGSLLHHLQRALCAELSKGCNEQRLLHACNEVIAERCQLVSSSTAAAAQRLSALREGQAANDMLPKLLDDLEEQTGRLEAAVAQLDASSRRLHSALITAGPLL
ncbi:hypothetical protein ACK3TF_000112 [Chlorella vulgaris]